MNIVWHVRDFFYIKGKVHPRTGHEVPEGEYRYSSTLFLTSALQGGEGSASRPGRILPPEKTRYPLYRRLGGPQGRSGLVRKISPPPGFDPRTVQPVGSRYTDYATRLLPLYIKTIIIYRSSDVTSLDNGNHIVLNINQCEAGDGRPNTSSPCLHPTLAQMKTTVKNPSFAIYIYIYT